VTAPAAPRFLRSLVVAVLILSLSLGSHVVGGGTLPAPAILLLLGVLVLAPVTALSGRAFPFPALVGVLLGGELAIHSALTALTGAAVCGSAAPAQHHGTAPHHVSAFTDCSALAGQVAGPVAGPGMFLAHAAAAAVLGLLMTRGEAALALLMAWLRPLAGAPEPFGVLPPHRPAAVACPGAIRLRRRDAAVPPLRGPPARPAPLPLTV
jgi:hypothetical protein